MTLRARKSEITLAKKLLKSNRSILLREFFGIWQKKILVHCESKAMHIYFKEDNLYVHHRAKYSNLDFVLKLAN